ncbi:hypothetical protein [Maridesulfovibrio sp.]|uniref:hypothetical protein n=1 Tax=Maridesulfovibrio sp. TaxID=2795000 RepID=UPI0029F52DE2|nr:hypothetical protein [Maridesulfovibrio sp.]
MDPITAVQSTIGVIKGALDITKGISDIGDAIKQADLKLQLAKLTESLADATINLSQVKVAINDKDEEIKELKTALEMKEKLKFNENYGLYEVEESGRTIRYCLKCHTEGKFVPVQETKRHFECKRCDQVYYRPEYRPQRPKKSNRGYY